MHTNGCRNYFLIADFGLAEYLDGRRGSILAKKDKGQKTKDFLRFRRSLFGIFAEEEYPVFILKTISLPF